MPVNPVGIGLYPPADQFSPGGLAPSEQSLIIDPNSDPPAGGPTSGGTQVFAGDFWATRVLTMAQCRVLFSVPQAIVLGTPNSIIIPSLLIGRLIDAASTPTNVTVAIVLRYTGIAGGGFNPMGGGLSAFFSASGAQMWANLAPVTNLAYTPGVGVDCRGRNLELRGNQDFTGGAANAYVQFWVKYTRLLTTQ